MSYYLSIFINLACLRNVKYSSGYFILYMVCDNLFLN